MLLRLTCVHNVHPRSLLAYRPPYIGAREEILWVLHEVEIFPLAEGTHELARVFTKELQWAGGVQDGSLAVFARQSGSTAGLGGEDVIRVHSSNDQGGAIPPGTTG